MDITTTEDNGEFVLQVSTAVVCNGQLFSRADGFLSAGDIAKNDNECKNYLLALHKSRCCKRISDSHPKYLN